MHAQLLQSCPTLCDSMDCHQASLCMGFSRQEYCSGLSCPPLRDCPDPGIEPAFSYVSSITGRFFTAVEAVLWTARSSQSVLREINPEYSLKGLMLKLKLQYFGLLMWTADSLESLWCWERLRTGEEGVREWDGCMASPMQWTWTWANFGRWWTGGLACCSPWGHKESDWVTKQQQEPINKVVVSGERQRDSAIHIHVSILPETLLPSCWYTTLSRILCAYRVGLCWLSILHIAVCT